jgi:hypothetical protein
MTDSPRRFSQREIKLEWIPVRNLAVVWAEAQRPYKEWWAKEIADAFDPEKFDPVKTMMPNGNGIHHICEGQHRVGAVRHLWGHDELVPCLVAQESDPARAADIFLDTNTNRDLVSRIQKFKVSVTAQRSEEVAINRIVQHCGYRVEGSKTQDTIAAVDALKFAYRKGKVTLDRTLHTLRDTWGGDPSAVQSLIIKGYSIFLCEFSQDIDRTRLRDVMAKHYTPGTLLNETKMARDVLKVSSSQALVHLITKTYNRGLPAARQLKRKGSKREGEK